MYWEKFTPAFLSNTDRPEQMSYGDHTKLYLTASGWQDH